MRVSGVVGFKVQTECALFMCLFALERFNFSENFFYSVLYFLCIVYSLLVVLLHL